jgi:hypothetical protein
VYPVLLVDSLPHAIMSLACLVLGNPHQATSDGLSADFKVSYL